MFIMLICAEHTGHISWCNQVHGPDVTILVLCLWKRAKFIGSSSVGSVSLFCGKRRFCFNCIQNFGQQQQNLRTCSIYCNTDGNSQSEWLMIFLLILKLAMCGSIKPRIKYYCWSVNKSTWINQVTVLACLLLQCRTIQQMLTFCYTNFHVYLHCNVWFVFVIWFVLTWAACSRRRSNRIKIGINKLHFAHVNKLWSNIHNNDYAERERRERRMLGCVLCMQSDLVMCRRCLFVAALL